MLQIVSKASRIVDHQYCREFRIKDDSSNRGYSFRCTKEGVLLPETLKGMGSSNGRNYYIQCLEGVCDGESVIDEGIKHYQYSHLEPARAKCTCGHIIILDSFTNTCGKCGADYSIDGGRLASRSQWGEETGESVSDILSVGHTVSCTTWNDTEPMTNLCQGCQVVQHLNDLLFKEEKCKRCNFRHPDTCKVCTQDKQSRDTIQHPIYTGARVQYVSMDNWDTTNVVYAKSVSTDDARFQNRAIHMYSGGDDGIVHTTIPVPNNTVLCNGCNSNIAETEEKQAWMIYLCKSDLKGDRPYDCYCESCRKRHFPKAEIVTSSTLVDKPRTAGLTGHRRDALLQRAIDRNEWIDSDRDIAYSDWNTTNYYDYGFDLPDCRDSYIDKQGHTVSITIVRHWEHDDGGEDDVSFKCSFDITRANETTSLPIGTNQSKAERIARLMYPEDRKASQEHYIDRSIELAEMRMGA